MTLVFLFIFTYEVMIARDLSPWVVSVVGWSCYILFFREIPNVIIVLLVFPSQSWATHIPENKLLSQGLILTASILEANWAKKLEKLYIHVWLRFQYGSPLNAISSSETFCFPLSREYASNLLLVRYCGISANYSIADTATLASKSFTNTHMSGSSPGVTKGVPPPHGIFNTRTKRAIQDGNVIGKSSELNLNDSKWGNSLSRKPQTYHFTFLIMAYRSTISGEISKHP